jgi:hypothetical protein
MIESFINETGVLPNTVEADLENLLNNNLDKLVTISCKVVKPTRSLLQNKYYWGVVIAMLSAEIGYAPDFMHAYMKQEFLWFDEQDMPDGNTARVVHDSKNLTTIQFDDYIQKIRNWAGEFLSLDIPLPNQTQFNYTGYE